ncbi:ABC transporter ATP-binding protein [Seleniivibrio woodruffii]|uniref:ABC transporter ATP-binding protein n=1 Tax=Seleniivibrio woodruffii TaxID=1078050 RepID=UPI0024095CE7|nr:ABC transporter ATP-binding protein [Seleniivibrio woodruffii]
MNEIAIRVENLSKVYRLYNRHADRLKEALHPLRRCYHKNFYALDNLSFEIKKGDTVGIIGKNGAGKSTLLKILTGVLTPSSGSVSVNGKVSSLLELGAGFNPQMTGIENVYLNGAIMGFSTEEMNAKIDEILSFADIGDFVYQPVKTYSSGMFARLAFAVAINVEPEILIVDEALSVGDVFFQTKCMAKMKAMVNKGITVLFVTHDIHAVRTFCSKAMYLENGRIIGFGDVEQLTSDYMRIQRDSANSALQSSELKISDMSDQPAIETQEAKSSEYSGILDLSGKKALQGIHSGNGKATILDFAILDKNGFQVSEIESCAEYSILMGIKFHEDMDSFAVVAPVRSLNGEQQIGVSSSASKAVFPPVKKDSVFVVRINSVMNIKQGAYTLTLAVELPIILNEIHEFLHVIENCAAFKVVWGSHRFPTTFFTDGSFEITAVS